MRKPKVNEFSLIANSNPTHLKSLLSFTISWLEDNGMSTTKTAAVKTALCEALSNVFDHAYDETHDKKTVEIHTIIYNDDTVKIAVRDEGKGVENLDEVQKSFCTCDPDNHSGMGFTVMKAFTDNFKVRSEYGKGTRVLLFYTLN